MKIQTVLGLKDPSELGYTLSHEHFQLDFNHFYCSPPPILKPILDGSQKIELGKLGFLRQYPYSSVYNITFNDQDTRAAVEKDLEYFKRFGGVSIVENSNHGLKRDLKFMQYISRSQGINVIAGTGHYIAAMQDFSTLAKSIEELSDLYRSELVDGDADGIKCGFIGEVGSGWPLHDFEKKAIQATAIARESVDCGVSFHPGRDAKAPFEIVRIYMEAGGKPEKCVMSHVDRTIMEVEEILEFAKLGTFVQFDLFGTECSFYQLNQAVDMISDAERIKKVQALISEGFAGQVLMSHDIHTKHRLIPFGGHGFSHILNNVLPKMKDRGVPQHVIDEITIDNPKRWLEGQFEK